MQSLPREGLFVLERLEQRGFESWFVGGVVRDLLRGAEAHDSDLASAATPQDVIAAFPDDPVLTTGARHGTVTVVVDHVPVEVTTFRTETTYADSRHPDEVRFASKLEDDLSRRDFTVNAMALHPTRGLVDLFGGREDLRRGVIRCVGDPAERFREDALRILRALRFASKLSFCLDAATADAARRGKDSLSLLSRERVQSECTGLLCGENARQVIVSYYDILSQPFPFLSAMAGFDQHNEHHCFDLLGHTAAVVGAIAPVPRLRLAALLHDCEKPACFSLDADGVGHFYGHASRGAKTAETLLRGLKYDNATLARVPLLVKWHDAPLEETPRMLKRRLNQMGEDALRDLLALQRADTLGLAPRYHDRLAHFDRLEAMLDEVLAQDACFSVKKLAVSGNDLKELGLRGREIGQAQRRLVDAVIDEKVKNEKDALLAYLKQ
ncbi:MAG: tRNA nucleotidyltransferase [Clostridia bacterium]|nr:tRNA nucleotidyltransferase [Clostridia bacterium]